MIQSISEGFGKLFLPGMLSVLLLSTGSVSCGTTDPPSTYNTMSAIIDNVTWNAISVKASREGNNVLIEGESATGATLLLTLQGDTLGTYLLGEGVHQGELRDEGVTWRAHGMRSGSATLTEITEERVAGFFGFRAKDLSGLELSRDIVTGRFDIDFIQ